MSTDEVGTLAQSVQGTGANAKENDELRGRMHLHLMPVHYPGRVSHCHLM